MNHLKTTIPAIAVVLALAAIPISQQVAEGTRLRSELQAARDQPANAANAVRGPRTASRSPVRKGLAEPWSPRTAGSLLDDLRAPVDYRELARQVISLSSLSLSNEDPWTCSIVYARLDSLSKGEFSELLNVLADYPAPQAHKKFATYGMRLMHPGLTESWQGTLERIMERGRGGNYLDSMGYWARENPDAALAWYREKVASGEISKGFETKFEKKTFESLVRQLAASRPKEALQMFRERPPELRSPGLAYEITRKVTKRMIETGDDTYLRQMLELHNESRVLQAALVEYGDALKFGDGVSFVEKFGIDPDTRAHLIMLVAEQDPMRVLQDEKLMDGMEEYAVLRCLAMVDPAAAVRLLPEIEQPEDVNAREKRERLGAIMLRSDFERGLALLMEMRESDPDKGDGMKSLTGGLGREAIPLRPGVVRKLEQAMSDPNYAGIRNDLIKTTLDHHLSGTGVAAVARRAEAMALTPEEIKLYLDSVGEELIATEPTATLEWMGKALTADQQSQRMPEAVVAWANQDMNAATDWLDRQKSSPVRDQAIARFATEASELDPEAAAAWAREIQNEQLRKETLRQMKKN